MQLSILICSLESRREMRSDLLRLLVNTLGESRAETETWGNSRGWICKSNNAEILICEDNKQMSVGAKRNLLLSKAQGKYVAFVDDDDMVAVDYVAKLLQAAEKDADVIVFDAVRYENGIMDRRVSYGIEYGMDYTNKDVHYRLPNHLMCFRKEIAIKAGFPELSFGEDSEFARRVLPMIKKQERIYETLYEYWFDKNITETQKR